jgi:uncharacterized protein with PIN domain
MADNMLGTLAKWLRVAGVDCDYAEGMEDDSLVQVSQGGRVVLSRDRLLVQRCGPMGLLVASDDLEEQILLVLRTFPGLMEAEPLSRCLVCNVPVQTASAEEVADRAPDGVLDRHDEFLTCPRCGRVYWEGSHVADMLGRLSEIKERARQQGPG